MSINSNNATLFQQQKNDKGDLSLTSSTYNLADKQQNSNFTAAISSILSTSSSIASAVGEVAESSNASFRLTNSMGMLDFKFYANGWKGNQWVTTAALSKLSKGIKWGKI